MSLLLNFNNWLYPLLGYEKNVSLQTRMTRNIKKPKCHPYKAHIVSLKSPNVLQYVNKISNLQDKLVQLREYNKLLIDVSKELYTLYDPHMIYCFNNELHLVFFYNDKGDYIYNGDIMKTVSSIVSSTTALFTKKFTKGNNNILPIFTGTFAEFTDDYETLNYIIWRQFDCKRNNITLLYRCLNYTDVSTKTLDTTGLTPEFMLSQLENNGYDIPVQFLNGNIIKKQIFYTSINITEFYDRIDESSGVVVKDEELVMRKDFSIQHIKLDENFKKSMNLFIKNKVL